MTLLSWDRYCAEIVAQTGLLTSCIEGADLTVPVPSCPGWDASQLLRHLGRVQRWAETVVRSRATEPVPVGHSGGLPARDDPAGFGSWLADGAARLVATLREAGPDMPVWTPVPGGTTAFYGRRFTHETALHRADAALALGAPFTLGQPVAADAIDERLALGVRPVQARRELLGPGRTLHFHATDTPPGLAAEWVVDLTGDAIAWRRAHEKAAVAVRGPLTDLLLIIYQRRPARSAEILGDAALLDFWLERTSFGWPA